MSRGIPNESLERGVRIRPVDVACILLGIGLAVAGILLTIRGQVADHSLSAHTLDPDSTSAWFQNVAESTGINFMHESGQGNKLYMPESMTGGVALLDYDGDGFLDVYFVQGGRVIGPRAGLPGNRLYRNTGDGKFEDVTEQAGVGDIGYGMGCATGDFDNDGWTDLYVTNAGPNVLYRNNGDGTFSDVTTLAGVGDPSFSASAAFVDYDHDGYNDLIVVNYLVWSAATELTCRGPTGRFEYCVPTNYNAPAPDKLFHNNGDGTFTDTTVPSGISTMFGNGLGVVAGDFNNDGLIDICVANDETANQLWINLGDGTFRDRALEWGVAYDGGGQTEAGMGIDTGDIDADGDLDLFMTHFTNETNTLYINHTQFFADETSRWGLEASLPFTGFGAALHDFNNDGWLDVYVANGRINRGFDLASSEGPYAEPNLLFQGTSDRKFREIVPRGGTERLLKHASRGAAFGDYNNDGRIDIFVVNRDARPYVLRNQNKSKNHWVMFRVVNELGADALGARVTIHVVGKDRKRDVRTAYSYCSANDPRVHFGLGTAMQVENVRVTWPDGKTESFGGFLADRIQELRRLSCVGP